MTNAYLETEKGQNELERLAATQKREGSMKAIEWDTTALLDAADVGFAMYDLSRKDKQEAEKILAGWTEQDIQSINQTINSLRQSRNSEIQAQLNRMRIIQESFAQKQTAEIAQYEVAQRELTKIMVAMAEMETALKTQPPFNRIVQLEMKGRDQDGLTETEKEEKKKLEDQLAITLNGMSSDIQSARDAYDKTVRQFTSRPDPSKVLADELGSVQ
jgi:hypothetical protein